MKNTDTFTRYVSEIGGYERITPEKEVALSQIILDSSDLDEKEAAVNELIVSNLRLVVHCAKDFLHYTTHSDSYLTEMDLIAEGNIGLMSAARGFDAQFSNADQKGGAVRFSTYACKCIKRRMLRAIRLSKFIHIPEHHFTCRKKIGEMEEKYGDSLNDSTLAQEIGVTQRKMRMVREGQDSQTWRLEDMSMDEGMLHWSETIEDPSAPRPDMDVMQRDFRQIIVREIKKLPERTQRIILKIFLSSRPFTFRELSEEFQVSKERCRQICVQGLTALRKQIEPILGAHTGVGLVFEESEDGEKRGTFTLTLSPNAIDPPTGIDLTLSGTRD